MAAAEAGASQPGDSCSAARGSADVSQPGETTRKLAAAVVLRLGSFNFGIDQNQLLIKKPTKKQKFLETLCGIVARAVVTGELDLFFGQEVGGHREGLAAAGLNYREILRSAFGEDWQAQALQNYTAVWNVVSETFVLHMMSSDVVLLCSRRFTQQCDALEPQLAMWGFKVLVSAQGRYGYLIVGNLHVA